TASHSIIPDNDTHSCQASAAGEVPAATAVSKVRSAALRPRTVVQRRSQRLRVAKSGRLASAARRRRGAWPSQSAATRRGAGEQGKVGLPFRQKAKEVAERNKDRHADAPTVAVVNPEQCGLPHDIRWRHAGRKLAVNGFGGDKPQDMLKAVVEPPAPMRCRFGVAEGGPHTDFAITHHGGAGRRGRPPCTP